VSYPKSPNVSKLNEVDTNEFWLPRGEKAVSICGKNPGRIYDKVSSRIIFFRRVALVAGLLIGVSPSVSESAPFLDGEKIEGWEIKIATQKIKMNGSAGQVAADIAGVANMDARYLASENFPIQPRLVHSEFAKPAFLPIKVDGRILERDSATGRGVENLGMAYLLVSIEEASQKIMPFHLEVALAPKKPVDNVQAEKGREAMQANPKSSGKGRIEAEMGQKGNGLDLAAESLLGGGTVLFFERNWEFAASIVRKSVFESGDALYNLESVIISIFWRYRF
jgi:hypothetical protein